MIALALVLAVALLFGELAPQVRSSRAAAWLHMPRWQR